MNWVSNNATNTASTALRHLDPETDFKVRQIVSGVNEVALMAANEPSMGLYRIQEHVHRTLPVLVQRKNELKKNMEVIEGAIYDLGMTIDVIDSISKIQHFTRIQAALNSALDMKRKLNIKEESEKARKELDTKNAMQANRSLSQNERAEGYICPVCYFALTSQDELISHWQTEHNLKQYENDVFEDVSTSEATDVDGYLQFTVDQQNDLTVIELPKDKERTLSAGEDVLNNEFVNKIDENVIFHERSETSASDGSTYISSDINNADAPE